MSGESLKQGRISTLYMCQWPAALLQQGRVYTVCVSMARYTPTTR